MDLKPPIEAFEELASCFVEGKSSVVKTNGNHFSWFRSCQLLVWVFCLIWQLPWATVTSDM